jgi:hypothetical protein
MRRTAGDQPLRASLRHTAMRVPKTFLHKHLLKLVLAGAVVLAIVFGAIFKHIQNEKERSLIFGLLASAGAEYERVEIAEAAQIAASARRVFQRKRSLFDEASAKHFEKSAQFFEIRCNQKHEADEIQWGARMDFPDARQKLEAMIATIEKSSDRTGPILAYANKALENVKRAELTHVRKDLDKEANKAKIAYLNGKIQEAKTLASRMVEKLNSLPEPMTKDFAPRIRAFADRVCRAEKILEKAKLLQEEAEKGGDFTAVIKEIEVLATQVSANEDFWVYQQLQKCLAQIRSQQRMVKEAQEALEGDGGKITQFAQAFAKTSKNMTFIPNSVNVKNLSFKVKCSEDTYTIYLQLQALAIQAGDYYYKVPLSGMAIPELELRSCSALAAVMRRAGLKPNAKSKPWIPVTKSSALPPAPMAILDESLDKEVCSLFILDRVYEVRQSSISEDQLRPAERFANAAKQLADAVEQGGKSAEEKEVCQAIAAVIRATYQPPQPNDFLPQSFCRRIVAQGYMQKHVPEVARQHQTLIESYSKEYQELTAKGAVMEKQRPGGSHNARKPPRVAFL